MTLPGQGLSLSVKRECHVLRIAVRTPTEFCPSLRAVEGLSTQQESLIPA